MQCWNLMHNKPFEGEGMCNMIRILNLILNKVSLYIERKHYQVWDFKIIREFETVAD